MSQYIRKVCEKIEAVRFCGVEMFNGVITGPLLNEPAPEWFLRAASSPAEDEGSLWLAGESLCARRAGGTVLTMPVGTWVCYCDGLLFGLPAHVFSHVYEGIKK